MCSLKEVLFLDVYRYLSLSEFADRAGLSVATMKSYLRKGLLPDPDALVGRNLGWKAETVDYWIHNRLGRGARTDLRPR